MKYDINKYAPAGDRSKEAKKHNLILEYIEVMDYDYTKIVEACEYRAVADDVLMTAVYQILEHVDEEYLREVIGIEDEYDCDDEPQQYGMSGMWQLGFRFSDFI